MPIDNTDLKAALKACTATFTQAKERNVINYLSTRHTIEVYGQMADDNKSWFRLKMWDFKFYKYPRQWVWPRIAIYDYSGNSDGRFVYSWVIHFGPLWIIRQRYAL